MGSASPVKRLYWAGTGWSPCTKGTSRLESSPDPMIEAKSDIKPLLRIRSIHDIAHQLVVPRDPSSLQQLCKPASGNGHVITCPPQPAWLSRCARDQIHRQHLFTIEELLPFLFQNAVHTIITLPKWDEGFDVFLVHCPDL